VPGEARRDHGIDDLAAGGSRLNDIDHCSKP
jgi:hypothetical protein